eukprot:4129531-Pleurochrysis_carterae.AAC.2
MDIAGGGQRTTFDYAMERMRRQPRQVFASGLAGILLLGRRVLGMSCHEIRFKFILLRRLRASCHDDREELPCWLSRRRT